MTPPLWKAGVWGALLAVHLAAPVFGQSGTGAAAATPAVELSAGLSADTSIVARFLAAEVAPLDSYRAVRHLEAATRNGRWRASMDVLTECDPVQGFRFTVLRESGSGVIRRRVFLKALEAEKEARAPTAAARGALTELNYTFVPEGRTDDGLMKVRLRPKRADALLVTGQMLVTPGEADLVAVEGRLVKRPSLWTRRVDVSRRWARIAGARVPVHMSSTADVLVAGTSTFQMTYAYELVNGRSVTASADAPALANSGNQVNDHEPQ